MYKVGSDGIAVLYRFAIFLLISFWFSFVFFFFSGVMAVRTLLYFFLARLFLLSHVSTILPLCRVFLFLNLFSQALSLYRNICIFKNKSMD